MRSLLPLLILPAWTVHGLRFDITGRSVSLLKSINANVLAAEDHSDDIISTRDVLYMANVTIDGTSYPLQMDTGSSDLWVDMGSKTPSHPTTTTLNLTYGTGNVFGPIAHGPVSFAGYDVPDQAFLVFQSGHNPVFSFGAQGIVGLGFTTLSHIDAAVSESWASSLLYNIFAQNPSEPNFIAMALERDSDEHNTVRGSLGVGELSKEYESISDTEHIPLFPPEGSKRWTVLLDSYAVNGVTQNATSTVSDVPSGRLAVLLDSGTTYSYAPPEIASSIYSSITGAFLNSTTNQWNVPCSAGIRLTLWIAGRPFDIHPLDIVVQSLAEPTICIGSFIPTRIAVGASDFDWILGTNILRSMYAVYDFGDFDSNNVMGDPYIQLLSVVDIAAAASSFQAARGGSVPINSGNGAASASVSVMTTSQKLDKLMDLIPLMFAALGANALILLTILGIGIWLCCHMRKQKARKPRNAPLPLTTVASSNHAYEAVSTADDEGRPSSVHTRRSMRMLSRSGSKHSLSSRSIKNEGDLVRPSITVNRDDDNASIRSGRVPVGGDASRHNSRLTPPDGNSSPSPRQNRFPSNMAPNPSSPLSNTFSTSKTPEKTSQEEEGMTDVMLKPHKDSLEDEKSGDVSLAKGKRSSFRPPPPIVAPGYRMSTYSEFDASPTVAGSEYHHGARERTMSTHMEVPVRQGSHHSDTSQPSPTESSYQDARQSYYSQANGSLSAFPVETPNTGRTSMMVPSPNSAASPAGAVDNIHTIPEAGSSHRRTASRQEAQRAAFLATLDEPLPPPRRPRAASRGLQVAQDNGGRMSAYHARSPSQEVQFPSQPNRHSYAPGPNSPGFVGGRGYPPAPIAEGAGPQRSSYVAGSSSRRGPFVSTPSPFNPSSLGSNAPSRSPPAPPS